MNDIIKRKDGEVEGSGEVSTVRSDFIKTSDNQVNFLQYIMSIVKTGGRVAVFFLIMFLPTETQLQKLENRN